MLFPSTINIDVELHFSISLVSKKLQKGKIKVSASKMHIDHKFV